MTATGQSDLGTTAAHAVVWNYASFASGKVLVLITMGILARLLTPADFGMVGFATLAIAHLSVLQNLGLGPAVIQRKGDIEDAAQTVFVINLILGAVFTVITILAAPLVAGFFDEPLVTPLLRVLAFSFILESLGSMHTILLRRKLAFRRKLIPDVGRALVQGGVAVTTALTGLGVWALVWGQLAGIIAYVALTWLVIPWRPTYRFHRHLFRPLARFGVPLVLTDIQHAIWSNLDYVIVGRMLGDAALGIYTLAYRLPELLVQSVWRVLANAIFPVFSRIQDDIEALRRGFLATVRYTQIAIVPLCIGMFLTAEPAVELIFGDQWQSVVPVLRVMAVFSLIGSIGVNIGDVYKAIGRPDILAKLSMMELVLLLPALLYGARFGILGVAWAHAAVATVDTIVRLIVARFTIGVSIRDIARQLIPSFGAGAWLIAAAVPTLWLTANLGTLTTLVATAAIGSLTYLVALWRLDQKSVRRILQWLGVHRFAGAE
jgi:O-antigen/teichoic acid export membrane protein